MRPSYVTPAVLFLVLYTAAAIKGIEMPAWITLCACGGYTVSYFVERYLLGEE